MKSSRWARNQGETGFYLRASARSTTPWSMHRALSFNDFFGRAARSNDSRQDSSRGNCLKRRCHGRLESWELYGEIQASKSYYVPCFFFFFFFYYSSETQIFCSNDYSKRPVTLVLKYIYERRAYFYFEIKVENLFNFFFCEDWFLHIFRNSFIEICVSQKQERFCVHEVSTIY